MVAEKHAHAIANKTKGSNPDMTSDGPHFTDKMKKYSVDIEKAQKVAQSAFQDDVALWHQPGGHKLWNGVMVAADEPGIPPPPSIWGSMMTHHI